MLSLLSNLLKVILKFASIFQQTRQAQAGKAEVIAQQAKETADAIQKAEQARADVRASTDSIVSTDGLPDDGFRRD